MLVQIKTENGQKKVIPLTADAGAGLPVGFIGHAFKKGNYSGWLYCDGSTFDETKYPLLYAYLGTNVLPDLREVGLKGAEKNTTYIFDSTETDPRTGQAGTQNHDVFAQGEFKDDQVQSHSHNVTAVNNSQNKVRTLGSGDAGFGCSSAGSNPFVYEQGQDGRKGTVTRGKSFGVYFYIKATSGLSENAQDNVVAQINEQRSYSTEEHLTGKKWIDGKPTYEKTFVLSNVGTSYTINVNNLDNLINYYGNCIIGSAKRPYPFSNSEGVNNINSYTQSVINLSNYFNMSELNITVEYTKTTD